MRSAVFGAALLLTAVAAQAVVVTFDNYPGPDGMLGTADDVPIVAPTVFASQPMQLTNEFASVGLLFTPDPSIDNQNEILNGSSFTRPPASTLPNLLASQDTRPITGRFPSGVNRLGAILGISGGSDQLEVFDIGGMSLGSIVGDDTYQELISATPIASFRITAVSGGTPAIDNLEFDAVPEPASLGLLAGAGLMVMRRRR